MTPSDFTDRLTKYVAEVRQSTPKIVGIAVQDVLAAMLDRIFVDGKDTGNRRIGRYSTKSISVTFPIPGLPTPARSKGKTITFPGGYKEFRAKVGRQNKFVNLDLTGSLRLSVKVGKSGKLTAIGFDAAEGRKRATENEERFKKRIFGLTDEERALFINRVASEIDRIQKKYFP
jgi:hypothetical protein